MIIALAKSKKNCSTSYVVPQCLRLEPIEFENSEKNEIGRSMQFFEPQRPGL